MSSKLFCVEGNIGSGKSRLIERLNAASNNLNINFKTFQEPIEEWRADDLLKKFYEDKYTWAFPFQVKVLSTFARIQNAPGDKIMERSIYSGIHCFAKLLLRTADLNLVQYKILQELCSIFSKDVKFIYLRTQPDIAYWRMRSRNRPEEASISFEYIEELHKLHEDWLLKLPNVKIIDGDNEIDNATFKGLVEFLNA